MKAGNVTLVCNVKNTFVTKDVALLKTMGYKVRLIHSPPYRDPIRFVFNRIREMFLGFYYALFSDAFFSWFNDYHTSIPLFWANLFGKPTTIIVGGFDAISSPALGYGIFFKKNLRQLLARLNYNSCDNIWVVHKSLKYGCPTAKEESGTHSGILNFMPQLNTPIFEVPTAYDASFWRPEGDKESKNVITVANISDTRTFERKGIPLLIEIAKALPDVQFTIAGVQTLTELKSKVPTNIQLLGTQSREELKGLYGKHMYYFQGSKAEGLPNVLCEAMLCECIPLGSAIFGIPDTIGASGLVFHKEDALSLLTEILTGKKKFNGANARKRIQELYSIERRKKAFLGILKTSKNESN
ncbi:MAG: glycosyltransferase involved in cell wall biosynthesis [Flavobacteriaceae bacterium]|jgi:glycosyltransferase involved in cell wall biosynthesis|tara:strand:+ start:6923 stop:7987 length:1065 start_codon:yes stop_codon:yes gene_type:complete